MQFENTNEIFRGIFRKNTVNFINLNFQQCVSDNVTVSVNYTSNYIFYLVQCSQFSLVQFYLKILTWISPVILTLVASISFLFSLSSSMKESTLPSPTPPCPLLIMFLVGQHLEPSALFDFPLALYSKPSVLMFYSVHVVGVQLQPILLNTLKNHICKFSSLLFSIKIERFSEFLAQNYLFICLCVKQIKNKIFFQGM